MKRIDRTRMELRQNIPVMPQQPMRKIWRGRKSARNISCRTNGLISGNPPIGKVFGPFYSESRRDYVAIVASDEEGKYICVRQYRQGINEVTTEFPAGGIERADGRAYGPKDSPTAAEDALEAARRELLEETGYVSDDWKALIAVPSNATISDNYAYVFVAKNCRKSGEQHLDETEFLNVRKYSAAEIEEMISQGKFQQAIHIMAWLLAQRP